jgi:RND family efflux transporter MFP subunit
MENQTIVESEEMSTPEVQTSSTAATVPPHTAPPSGTASKHSLIALLIVVGIGAVVIGYVILTGIASRAKADADLQRSTLAMSIPTVGVAHPKVAADVQEVVVPGNMQAFIDTPIWARSNGYLKAWHVDIGARVKAGQLLGEIESPETDQQLQQAREDLTTAEANQKLAEITSERYTNLFKTDSVAKQDVDNAVQDLAAKTATVSAARANVKRLEQLVGYEHIEAPFDGVVTARNIDVGALVNSGANTPGKELFHLASTSTLRVYVNVPEVYERAAKAGVKATLTLNEFPGKEFVGTVVRNAASIDQASRTLLVEVDVKNSTGELLPGSYVSVHLKLPSKVKAVTVPVSAVLFRAQGLQVATVKDGAVHLIPVSIGRDYGDEVELLSGIDPADLVVVTPSDSIYAGQKVQVKQSGT